MTLRLKRPIGGIESRLEQEHSIGIGNNSVDREAPGAGRAALAESLHWDFVPVGEPFRLAPQSVTTALN